MAENRNKVGIVTLLFILISICDIVGVLFNIDQLRYFSKPLLMASLALLYILSFSEFNTWYISALIFSFFGDVFLLFAGEMYFMLGLVSFLIAHIIYIKIVQGWLVKPTTKSIIVSAIPFAILFIVLINLLKSSLNDLFIPVVIYGITISVMGMVSLLYYMNTKSRSGMFMLIGATFFVLSDSVLAINKFYNANKMFSVIIMTTYIIAQYLIYKSVITRNEHKKLIR